MGFYTSNRQPGTGSENSSPGSRTWSRGHKFKASPPLFNFSTAFCCEPLWTILLNKVFPRLKSRFSSSFCSFQILVDFCALIFRFMPISAAARTFLMRFRLDSRERKQASFQGLNGKGDGRPAVRAVEAESEALTDTDYERYSEKVSAVKQLLSRGAREPEIEAMKANLSSPLDDESIHNFSPSLIHPFAGDAWP